MEKATAAEMSRRERQIMDVVHRLGSATAAQVLDELPDPPGYSAVRSALRLLEETGHLARETDGSRSVYRPTAPRGPARTGTLLHFLRAFF